MFFRRSLNFGHAFFSREQKFMLIRKSNYMHCHVWPTVAVNRVLDIQVLFEENWNDIRIFRRELPEGGMEIEIRKFPEIFFNSNINLDTYSY